jgi:hypothetical protein
MAMDDDQDRYWTQPTGSGKNSGKRVPAKITSPAQAALDRSNWITKCAQQILGSYRRDDFADPDIFLVQLGMVLERYDDAVIRAVTSPVTGIQRTCKFPPSIAEFVEFVDEHVRRSTFASNYDERSKRQLEEDAELERQRKTEPPEVRAAVVALAKEELRAKGFRFEGDTKPAENHWNQFSAADLLAKYPPKHPKQEAAE